MDSYMLPLFIFAAGVSYVWHQSVNTTPINDNLRGVNGRNTVFTPQ